MEIKSQYSAFNSIKPDWTGIEGNSTVQRPILANDGFNDPILSLSIQNSTSSIAALNLQTICAKDFYAVARSGSILDAIQATITQAAVQVSSVAGPLPLLGAGTAFGFSRRLRRRCRLRHAPGSGVG